MPSHWTYGDCTAEDDLLQGDIISRSNELLALLREVFPYFCDERYVAFLVTTQSCDLVRRGGAPCKAQYISLAVVRELRPLLPEFLNDVCGSEIPGVYKKESRFLAEQLLVKIINQNEQARGLFYLHQDADVGIATPSIALLRVTFSLRRKHYDLLASSRTGRICGEFANKLGWLTGNLFSRVATPDWEDQEGRVDASRTQAKQLLKLVSEANDQNWVSEDWIREAKRKQVDLSKLTPRTAHYQLEEYAPLEPIEVVLQRIQAIGRELWAERELKFVLRKSEELAQAFTRSLARSITGLTDDHHEALISLLSSDDSFRAILAGHISSEAKKAFKSDPPSPVASLCDALAQKRGTIKPVIDLVLAAISKVSPETEFDLNQELVDVNLFTADVLEHVQAAAESLESEFSERSLEISKRLKRDARIKTAFRRNPQPHVGNLD